MRIGIFGTHGVGKTTLAEMLAKEWEVLRLQIAEELTRGSFVSDRTVFDGLAYWVLYGLDMKYPMRFRYAWQLAAAHVAAHPYDGLIYVPVEFANPRDEAVLTCEGCRRLLGEVILAFLRDLASDVPWVMVTGSPGERLWEAVKFIASLKEEERCSDKAVQG